jgi:hypothetical protein
MKENQRLLHKHYCQLVEKRKNACIIWWVWILNFCSLCLSKRRKISMLLRMTFFNFQLYIFILLVSTFSHVITAKNSCNSNLWIISNHKYVSAVMMRSWVRSYQVASRMGSWIGTQVESQNNATEVMIEISWMRYESYDVKSW